MTAEPGGSIIELPVGSWAAGKIGRLKPRERKVKAPLPTRKLRLT